MPSTASLRASSQRRIASAHHRNKRRKQKDRLAAVAPKSDQVF
jgi:hypothetical protein